jgi:hypothetical protein
MAVNKYLISISCAHGTGKTTLIEEVKKYFPNNHLITFLKEFHGRNCEYPLGQNCTAKTQWWILDQFREYSKFFKYNEQIIITDRSIIDVIPYTLWSKNIDIATKKQIVANTIQLYVDIWQQCFLNCVDLHRMIFFLGSTVMNFESFSNRSKTIEDLEYFKQISKSFQDILGINNYSFSQFFNFDREHLVNNYSSESLYSNAKSIIGYIEDCLKKDNI